MMLERFRKFAKDAMKGIKRAGMVHVVYTDVDTICLRASSGRDITFILSPDIDKDDFIQSIRNMKHPEYSVGVRRHFTLGVFTNDEDKASKPQSILQKINVGIGGDYMTSYDLGKYLGVSGYEAGNMMTHATTVIIRLLAEQGRTAQQRARHLQPVP